MNESKEGRNASFFDLGGKISLITGAGRGIGRAVALALARAGSDVALVARTREQLHSVAQEIQNLGRQAMVFPADLTQIQHFAALTDEISRKMGGIDILVNNAGINIPLDSVDVTEEAWDAIMDINLKGAFFLAQAVGKIMIVQARGGRIINISSQTGSIALAKRAAYCASKAGLNLVTKVLAMEWASHGILVNAVAPTFIETELTKDFLADPEFRQYALAKNLLKRFGTPDDVAGAVLYLASPIANMVTGHVLLVDAGWTAH
jgi:NAD(P)-dependent dehydrogenase (short-subunit alcohol dehydrogenase family)